MLAKCSAKCSSRLDHVIQPGTRQRDRVNDAALALIRERSHVAFAAFTMGRLIVIYPRTSFTHLS